MNKADFILECLCEYYTKIDFNNYTLVKDYNRVIIILNITLNNNEYSIRISCDFNMPISKILNKAKSDINQLILNSYK